MKCSGATVDGVAIQAATCRSGVRVPVTDGERVGMVLLTGKVRLARLHDKPLQQRHMLLLLLQVEALKILAIHYLHLGQGILVEHDSEREETTFNKVQVDNQVHLSILNIFKTYAEECHQILSHEYFLSSAWLNNRTNSQQGLGGAGAERGMRDERALHGYCS